MSEPRYTKQQSDFEDTILDLIDNRDDYTRSDLQGAVSAIVMPLLAALQAIAWAGGNLSDEVLTSKTGPNDAVARGLMYVECRRVALRALTQNAKGESNGTRN